MPTNKKIVSYSLGVVALWSNRHQSLFTAETKLIVDLNLNAVRLRTMVGALRSYVQLHNESQTLLVREVKSAKKLGPLVQLIIKRATDRVVSDEEVKVLIKNETTGS